MICFIIVIFLPLKSLAYHISAIKLNWYEWAKLIHSCRIFLFLTWCLPQPIHFPVCWYLQWYWFQRSDPSLQQLCHLLIRFAASLVFRCVVWLLVRFSSLSQLLLQKGERDQKNVMKWKMNGEKSENMTLLAHMNEWINEWTEQQNSEKRPEIGNFDLWNYFERPNSNK